jgi:hypothetical protein
MLLPPRPDASQIARRRAHEVCHGIAAAPDREWIWPHQVQRPWARADESSPARGELRPCVLAFRLPNLQGFPPRRTPAICGLDRRRAAGLESNCLVAVCSVPVWVRVARRHRVRLIVAGFTNRSRHVRTTSVEACPSPTFLVPGILPLVYRQSFDAIRPSDSPTASRKSVLALTAAVAAVALGTTVMAAPYHSR